MGGMGGAGESLPLQLKGCWTVAAIPVDGSDCIPSSLFLSCFFCCLWRCDKDAVAPFQDLLHPSVGRGMKLLCSYLVRTILDEEIAFDDVGLAISRDNS